VNSFKLLYMKMIKIFNKFT